MQKIRSNVKLVLKLGAGFFADAYDLFVIDLVLSILQEQASVDPSGMGFTQSSKALIASATSIGAVVGMLLFGVIGDRVGRRAGVLVTGSLVAIGSLLSAACVRSETVSLMTQMTIYRTLLGVGIGGEYPLSASMASESSEAKVRGRVIAGVFAMQGVGMLFSSLLGYLLVAGFGASLEFSWRFLLAFGAVPAIVALYFRFRMHPHQPVTGEGSGRLHPETTFRLDENGNTLSTAQSIWRALKEYRIPLLATCGAWFLLDVTFYGTGEFKHSVSNELFPENVSLSSQQRVASDALFGIIVSSIALPGYICSCIFIDRIGRWRLQVYGFVAMTLVYIGMALAIANNSPNGLNLFIFGLTFFFQNFGPNCTTFIIPSEIYPTSVRATCHGLSAAFGKVGAIVGAAGFPACIEALRLDGVMYVCAGIAAAGFFVTIGLLDRKLVEKAATRPREIVVGDDSDCGGDIGSPSTDADKPDRDQSLEIDNKTSAESVTGSIQVSSIV
jgi:PHS family inorganic phosphate transporter-like MFS transporter